MAFTRMMHIADTYHMAIQRRNSLSVASILDTKCSNIVFLFFAHLEIHLFNVEFERIGS